LIQLRIEGFNIANHANFDAPTAVLPDALEDVQPRAAFTPDLAAGFGLLNSTVSRTVGLGTARQFQLSLRFEF